VLNNAATCGLAVQIYITRSVEKMRAIRYKIIKSIRELLTRVSGDKSERR